MQNYEPLFVPDLFGFLPFSNFYEVWSIKYITGFKYLRLVLLLWDVLCWMAFYFWNTDHHTSVTGTVSSCYFLVQTQIVWIAI